MLVRALESDWAVLSEEIGLWVPIEVANEEHDDKPEGEEDSGNRSFFSQNIFFHLSVVLPTTLSESLLQESPTAIYVP